MTISTFSGRSWPWIIQTYTYGARAFLMTILINWSSWSYNYQPVMVEQSHLGQDVQRLPVVELPDKVIASLLWSSSLSLWSSLWLWFRWYQWSWWSWSLISNLHSTWNTDILGALLRWMQLLTSPDYWEDCWLYCYGHDKDYDWNYDDQETR